MNLPNFIKNFLTLAKDLVWNKREKILKWALLFIVILWISILIIKIVYIELYGLNDIEAAEFGLIIELHFSIFLQFYSILILIIICLCIVGSGKIE